MLYFPIQKNYYKFVKRIIIKRCPKSVNKINDNFKTKRKLIKPKSFVISPFITKKRLHSENKRYLDLNDSIESNKKEKKLSKKKIKKQKKMN